MECLVNDYNTTNNGLSIFVKDIFSKTKGKSNIDSWEEGLSLVENRYWDLVVDKLSKIEKCEKIIKTKDEYDDVILFISQDTSSRYVGKVMEVYTEILISDDQYFNILILDNDEYRAWANNTDNIVYWKKMI